MRRGLLGLAVGVLVTSCGDDGGGDSTTDDSSDTTATSQTQGTTPGTMSATTTTETTTDTTVSTTATTSTTGETDTETDTGVNDATDYVTFVGGSSGEQVRDVAVDGGGNIYIAGGTASGNFPTTAGAYDETQNGSTDVFVSKLAPDGSLMWSTFLGGNNYDRAYAIEVDDQGYVYVGGRADDGYPTTAGVLQESFGGDVNPNSLYGAQDAFITKLEPDGSGLVWSTFFGGDDRNVARDFAIDSDGAVYIAMTSTDRTFPHITNGSFQPSPSGGQEGVIAKISADATTLVWGSYFGGSGNDGGTPSVRVDDSGRAYYLTHVQSMGMATGGAYQTTYGGGIDLIVSRISADGSTRDWTTYVGGSMVEFTETHGLSIDSDGNAYVTATTRSTDLDTTPGAFQSTYAGSGGGGTGAQTNYPGDGFIWKISSDGSSLLAGTYLGGSVGEGIEGSGVDDLGNVYVSGATFSDDFPLANAYQGNLGGQADHFVAKLSPDLDTLLFGTFLGGGTIDFARSGTIDQFGNYYVIGETNSNDFPTTADAFQPNFGGGNGDGTLARLIGSAN